MEEKVLEIFCQCRGFLKVDRVNKGYCVAYFEADFELDKERLEKIGDDYVVTACFCQNMAQEFDRGFCLRVEWYQREE